VPPLPVLPPAPVVPPIPVLPPAPVADPVHTRPQSSSYVGALKSAQDTVFSLFRHDAFAVSFTCLPAQLTSKVCPAGWGWEHCIAHPLAHSDSEGPANGLLAGSAVHAQIRLQNAPAHSLQNCDAAPPALLPQPDAARVNNNAADSR
jgi:hypothetical protein